MEWLTADFWTGLLSIVIIDLVLAGDNAIVIGMAARNLPRHLQKRAIVWGTFGAIGIRATAALLVVQLLKIPGLLLAGGLLLLWIAFKLLTEKKEHRRVEAKQSVWGAVRTILIADAVMGLDNVLAIAGAAGGSFALVILGLLVSVPIVVWGSTLFIKWTKQFPAIAYVGAGILAFTAAKMLLEEPLLKPFVETLGAGKWLIAAAAVSLILWIGHRKNKAGTGTSPEVTV